MAKRKTEEQVEEGQVEVVTEAEATETAESEPKVIAGLTEGRMVHYVTDLGRHRPAVIVQVWDHGTGCSNLQVFTDGTNDGFPAERGTTWITSVDHSAEAAPGTWHFIERA